MTLPGTSPKLSIRADMHPSFTTLIVLAHQMAKGGQIQGPTSFLGFPVTRLLLQ
jgi:hypothetical protein